jgi:hypothetical protein
MLNCGKHPTTEIVFEGSLNFVADIGAILRSKIFFFGLKYTTP